MLFYSLFLNPDLMKSTPHKIAAARKTTFLSISITLTVLIAVFAILKALVNSFILTSR